MVGLERTVVPLIAEADFGLVSRTAVLSFIVTFGVVKAIANLFAGSLGDRWGRKRILIAGWLVGMPVPLLIIFAPSWGWIIFANVLLGINQGLCWSTTVIMKIDLVGPKQRGLAMGLNEFAGYLAVSLAALGSGYLAAAYGLRPAPFLPGLVLAVLGLLFSFFFVRETRPFAELEAQLGGVEKTGNEDVPSFAQILLLTSWKDKTLFSVSQAGMVNNLNDGMVWGLLPLFLAGFGLSVERIGLLAAAYPGVWGVSQLFTGALSDRIGRKGLIASGMWVQAVGIGLLVWGRSFSWWLTAVALLGLGTGMVYPTLLAAISDVAHPTWRGSAVGVYRLWRDGGYAVGALASGFLADLLGMNAAIAAIGALTLLSGVVVTAVMRETLPRLIPAIIPMEESDISEGGIKKRHF
ncbi:MAG: MFS transporter [Anaerolineae bacterium]|nr:MFS transporter [Anaerolineae bacterium]